MGSGFLPSDYGSPQLVQYLGRSAWTSTPRPSGLAALDANRVEGLAIHWPGSSASLGGVPTLAQSAHRLEQERVQHTSRSSSDPTKPWSDIAYSFAVDQAGRIFDLRGVDARSAANGDATVNAHWLACTVLLGKGDAPSGEAVEAVRWLRSNVILKRYPHATRVVGHRDLHQTACPGDALYALVRSGAFTHPAGTTPATNPIVTGGADVTEAEMDTLIGKMAADGDLLNAIAKRVGVYYGVHIPGDPKTLAAPTDALSQMWAALAAILATLPRLGAGTTTATPDEQATARAVLDSLEAALAARPRA